MEGLLLVDFQEGFVNNLKIKDQKNVITKVNKLLNLHNFDLIVFTKFNNENELFKIVLNYEFDMHFSDLEISTENLKNFAVFEKSTCGITNEIIEFLKQQNITKIYVAGLDLDACIIATMFNLFDNGIQPVLVLDACATPRAKNYKSSLKIIESNFGKNSIVTVEEIIEK